ncbi:MAG: hypothetical protein WBV90_19280, partial [Terrimicrobiaceae bacterium]
PRSAWRVPFPGVPEPRRSGPCGQFLRCELDGQGFGGLELPVKNIALQDQHLDLAAPPKPARHPGGNSPYGLAQEEQRKFLQE